MGLSNQRNDRWLCKGVDVIGGCGKGMSGGWVSREQLLGVSRR